jgi:hypothetical protein
MGDALDRPLDFILLVGTLNPIFILFLSTHVGLTVGNRNHAKPTGTRKRGDKEYIKCLFDTSGMFHTSNTSIVAVHSRQ